MGILRGKANSSLKVELIFFLRVVVYLMIPLLTEGHVFHTFLFYTASLPTEHTLAISLHWVISCVSFLTTLTFSALGFV